MHLHISFWLRDLIWSESELIERRSRESENNFHLNLDVGEKQLILMLVKNNYFQYNLGQYPQYYPQQQQVKYLLNI